MIRYFRINDPYRLTGVFLLFFLLYLPFLIDLPPLSVTVLKSQIIGEKLNEGYKMYSQLIDDAAPLAAWSYELFDTLFGTSVRARLILSFFIVFLQAAYFGIVLINRKVFNENTYIPPFIFLLLYFISHDTFTLTGELLGFIFLLFALNSIFKEFEFRSQGDETVFNIGIYVSIASLFSFGYWIFLFFALVALVSSGRATPRKMLLLLFGFLLPHLFVLSLTLLSGIAPDLWRYYYLANFSLDRYVLVEWRSLLALSAIPVFYLAISLVMLQREARFSKYQSMLLQLMFLWIGFSMIYLLFCKDLRPQSLIVFTPAVTLLITHFLLVIRRRKFVEINGWVLLLGVVTIAYLERYDKLDWVDEKQLLVEAEREDVYKNRRVLVLGDARGYYVSNTLATPYLNWSLSQGIFSEPGYYENLVHVYRAFKTDPPDVVIDRESYLKPFLDRMPEVAAAYQRQGDVYVRVKGK